MEENQPKTGKYSLIYGLFLGGISVAFALMLFSMDAHYSQDSLNTIISIIITVAIIIWGIISFKKANGGYLSLGEALKLGAGIAVIAGIIGVAYTMFLANVLDTEFITKVADAQRAAGIEAGTMTEQQIEQQYQGTLNYFWISYPIILIFNIIIGLIIGLLGGLILKKSKPME
ncbi:DUF4199 domain-containing protein [Eudoraea sp.]|uniref:DUF4199 domain-containing protein n=1 Tax=Eudoraea sp. TaxID=1979955 RepID=UPI003C772CF4